jgi:hypothetical protein
VGVLTHIAERLLDDAVDKHPHRRFGLRVHLGVELALEAALGLELLQLHPHRRRQTVAVQGRRAEVEDQGAQSHDRLLDGSLGAIGDSKLAGVL